jgi:hypothetical protein
MPLRLTEAQASRIKLPKKQGVCPVRSARTKAGIARGKRAQTLLAEQIGKHIPGENLVFEHRFHPDRGWKFDLAAPELMLALEVEGGAFSRGKSGHTTGAGFFDDCEKYAHALILGWRVLRVPTDWVWNGHAAALFIAAADPAAPRPVPLPSKRKRRAAHR